MTKNDSSIASLVEEIQQYILFIRGEKVMLDEHLAILYGVPTRVLVQAIKRNINRFPIDFMFQLTPDEFINLRSQIVISSWGGRRYTPYVFTEQGIAMLSSVLRSNQAIQVNIEIMRTFVHLRQLVDSHRDLRQQLKALEKKYDKQFKDVFEAIHLLMIPPDPSKKYSIGFHPWKEYKARQEDLYKYEQNVEKDLVLQEDMRD